MGTNRRGLYHQHGAPDFRRVALARARTGVREGVTAARSHRHQRGAWSSGSGITYETGRSNFYWINIIINDNSNKLNRRRKARVSFKVQLNINARLNAVTSTKAIIIKLKSITRLFFFFNNPAPPDISTLPPHNPLPI